MAIRAPDGANNDKGQTLLLGSIVKDNRVGKGVI